MSIFKSIVKALLMSKWFVKTSWGYIVTKNFESKVEYFLGVIPAWVRFTIATYKDCRRGY